MEEQNRNHENEHPQTHEPHHAPAGKSKESDSAWKIATGVLAVLLIISILIPGMGLNPGGKTAAYETGKPSASETSPALCNANKSAEYAIAPQDLGKKSVDYINRYLLQGQGIAKVDGIRESNGIYAMVLDVNGQKIDTYASKDGKLLFPQAINLDQAPQQQAEAEPEAAAPADAPKSDKPKVELFVMSHCPYGTQIEKGILPVAKTLAGKIDFEVKFVNYAMHGEVELQEELRQYCVQKDYRSKYLQYLGSFLGDGDSQKALSAAGLSDAGISACVKSTDAQFKVTESFNDPQRSGWNGNFPPFNVHDAENQKYGVQGSPTLVINGQQVNSGRDAKSLLATICNAFSSKPAECATDMGSYGNPGPGFGFGTQGGSAQTAGCGA